MLEIIQFYLPIGIIGGVRWLFWLAKKIISLAYKAPEEYGVDFSFSAVSAVYNEKPDILMRALDSWKSNLMEGDEIIAVIDYRDKSSIEVFRKFFGTFKNAKLIVTQKSGKRSALADGLKIAKGDIIAFVDSDTIWHKDIRKKLLAPFLDFRVGGVATRQEVFEPSKLQDRLFNIQLSNRYFTEFPFLAATGSAFTVLSGRTAFYRKTALDSIIDAMVNEKFFKKPCISGEDKALTRLIQEKGWQTKYVQSAVVMTPGAPDLLTFFRQQIRWARNSWRSDLLTLSSKWVWQREKILAFYMLDRFVQPFLLFLGPIYFFAAVFYGHWEIAAILLSWWLVSRSIKVFAHLRRYPKDILVMPAYVIMTYITAFIRIYALFSMNSQGWITRWGNESKQPLFALLLTLLVIFAIAFTVINYRSIIR